MRLAVFLSDLDSVRCGDSECTWLYSCHTQTALDDRGHMLHDLVTPKDLDASRHGRVCRQLTAWPLVLSAVDPEHTHSMLCSTAHLMY